MKIVLLLDLLYISCHVDSRGDIALEHLKIEVHNMASYINIIIFEAQIWGEGYQKNNMQK